jgi:negative regulator of flagellin synthesis FlgM
MKIDPGLSQVSLQNPLENRSAKTPLTQADGNQTAVSLSPRAAQLKALDSQLNAIPLVDRARVEQIKDAIANGQYRINTENIASGLLDSVRELLHVGK